MKKFPFSELVNLRTKPSDFRPACKVYQQTIDDLIPEDKYDETLVLKCNTFIPSESMSQIVRELIKQRKAGIIVLPPDFEVIGYFPSASNIEVVSDTNDAEKFIDDVVNGKYD